jgi:hypothetical protein
MTDLRQVEYSATIKIMKNCSGLQLGYIPAQCIQVNQLCTSLNIRSEDFIQLCKDEAKYQDLVYYAKERPQFDLNLTIESYPDIYRLTGSKSNWKLEFC